MGIATQFAAGMAFVGAIAGPGYAMYCDFHSGKEIGKYQQSQHVSDWATPDGQTLTFGPAGAFKPFIIELNPDMNPVGFVWSGYIDGGHKRILKYGAQLFLREQKVMDKSVAIPADDDDGSSMSKSIGTVSVPSAGQYHFVLKAIQGRDRHRVSGLQIEVRRNVVVKNMRIVWPGVGVLVVFGLLFFWLKNRERKALYELPEHVRGAQDHTLLTADFTVPAGVCPYCRKPLRTVRAKQCLLCGADWHTN